MTHEKILLVDDETMILESLAEFFSTNYEVETAINGQDALKKIEVFQPGLVITDISMPIMTGLDMMQELRDRNDQRAVIVFTSFGDVKNITRAMKLRAFDFFEKPIDLKQIESAVRVAFDIIARSQSNSQSTLAKPPQNSSEDVGQRDFKRKLTTASLDAAALTAAVDVLLTQNFSSDDETALKAIAAQGRKIQETLSDLLESKFGHEGLALNQKKLV